MSQFSFLNEKLPAQIGLITCLIIFILALFFLNWQFRKTTEEIGASEFYPTLLKGKTSIEDLGNPIKNIVEVSAEREILHYQKTSFWGEENFSKILKLQKKFEEREIKNFKESVAASGVRISNTAVEFSQEERSTIFSCEIKGAMYRDTYKFGWLFKNVENFNLFNFKASEKELKYDGEINSIPTKISLDFPFVIEYSSEEVWPK
jgi:hypothetical protein